MSICKYSLLGLAWLFSLTAAINAFASMEQRARTLVDESNANVETAQSLVDAARARLQQAQDVAAAANREAAERERAWRESGRELQAAQRRLQRETSNLAQLHVDHQSRQVAEARVAWERAVEQAHTAQTRTRAHLPQLAEARLKLAEAIAARLATRRAIEEEFKQHLPPWVTDVKVTGQDGLVYHGHWLPQNEDLRERMAALAAFIHHAPTRLTAIEADRDRAISMARNAVAATDRAMDEYRSTVRGDVAAQIRADLADVGQTLARDARAGGAVGLAVGSIVELGRAVRSVEGKRKYWDLERLAGLNQDYRNQLGTSEDLVSVGLEREAVLRLESAAAQARAHPNLTDGALKQEVQEIVLRTEPGASTNYMEVIAADTLKELLMILSEEALERASRSTNPRVSRILERLTGGDLAERETNFRTRAASFGLNAGADALIARGKTALLSHYTSERLKAFHHYLGRWVRQVWLENEMVQISRDYWALRNAVAQSELELDRLMGMHGSHRERNRVLRTPTNHELDNDSDFRIDITFSSDVEVIGVRVGEQPVAGRGTGKVWSGAFNTKDLAGRTPFFISARAPLTGYQLDSPYKAPLWSTDKNEFNDYTPGDDHYHFVSVEASEGSGITVGVADMFGPEGLRVLPAIGVKAIVYDSDGEELALSTIETGFLTKFISLKPGAYRLRLDIRDYVPALPPHCTDGYVRDFTLEKDEQLQFTASVYKANVAASGQSAGVVQGECIRLK